MTRPIEAFEHVVQLETADLRRLLVSPRPEQRVWAIWALALRCNGAPDVVRGMAQEPDPGVRRTLAVILASHGEIDLLVALAHHDPAIVVRASAMQVVTRLAASGAIDRMVVSEAARREPETQCAVLAAIDAGAPEFLVEIAGKLIDDGDDAVQLEAFEALQRVASPTSIARAMRWLSGAAATLVAEAFQIWTRLAPANAIAREVAPLPRAVRVSGLRALAAPSWQAVEQLAAGEHELLLEAALRYDVVAPAAVLVSLLTDHPGVQSAFAAREQLSRLDQLPSEHAQLIPHLRALCERRGSTVDAEVDNLFLPRVSAWRTGRPNDDDEIDDDGEIDDAIAELEHESDALSEVLCQLARLASSGG